MLMFDGDVNDRKVLQQNKQEFSLRLKEKEKEIERQKEHCLLACIHPKRTVSPPFNLQRKNSRYNNKEKKEKKKKEFL